MPIRPPALDDRSYEDLVSELIARIPAHTPEWTHPAPGDPGRTLIELFAWLGDTILYRANLIPERQRLAFLRLLGMPLKPARAARGLVALKLDPRATAPLEVRPGARIDKPLPYTTQTYCTAYPLAGRVYVKRGLSADEQRVFAELLPDLSEAYRIEGSVLPVGYRTQEIFVDGAADEAGIDLIADTVDRTLWMALMAPSAETREATRAMLAPGSSGARALNVGLVPAQQVAALDEDLLRNDRLPLVWEMSLDPGESARGLPPQIELDVLEDGSQGLRRQGVLRLSLPVREQIGAPSSDPRDNGAAGVGDAPPRLDNAEDAALLVAWLRLRVKSGVVIDSLRLSWAGLHAVEVEQRQALPPRRLGTSDGGSDQLFDLGIGAAGSVDGASLQVEVNEATVGARPWVALDDLGRAGPLDAAYRLDAEAGTLHFGDGVHGRVPATGSEIIVRGLKVGGGRAGNAPAGALKTLASVVDASGRRDRPAARVDLIQPLALSGGADAETLDAAEKRIPAVFQHRDRAVTAFDYRRLAREAPGSDVARVELLPRFKPQERAFDIPGVVSVMVLPARASTDFSAPYPRADRPLLEAVHAHLDARRPLATELYVIGCAYKPLGVSLAVQIREGHARETVLAEVRQALRAYLWPLESVAGALYWPAAADRDSGYPLGRALSDRELEVVAARVAGVGGISVARLFEQGQDGAWVERPGAGKTVSTFSLQAWELPELLALAVVEGVDAPASPRVSGAGAGGQGAAVFLPVVPETC